MLPLTRKHYPRTSSREDDLQRSGERQRATAEATSMHQLKKKIHLNPQHLHANMDENT